MKKIYKLIVSISILIASSLNAHAQFVDGTKGLLCMPSAEMEEVATFAITNNFLHKEFLPNAPHYGWNDKGSFNYAFSITLWARLEVTYCCTLISTERMRPGVYTFNQDRHFAARVAITKDGEWNQKWLPAIAVGLSDPVTGSGGDYINDNVGSSGNGYFNRYYIAVSKNFSTPWGNVGGHLGFQYSRRKDGMPTGPQAAITWNPVWLNNSAWFMNSFRVTLEYDARYVNFGINASIWKDRFEFMAMLLSMRYPMVGARFKLALSH